jgi:hypothetical protein
LPASIKKLSEILECMSTWRSSGTDAEAAVAARSLQARLENESAESGFWVDLIQKLPPRERLEMAIDHLPLPAAFNEAAIAIRALISQSMKERRDPSASLKLLYWISAIASFMPARAEKARLPGFSVVVTIPGTKLFGLKFDWKTLGYEQLPLLTARDVRMLVALWGQPEAHGTLLELHRDLWDEYEGKLAADIEKDDKIIPSDTAAFKSLRSI